MNQLDMQGRGAIVTGGAAGIGYAIAQRLAASGARVSLWDRDARALQAAAKSLGANTYTHMLDVTRCPHPHRLTPPRRGWRAPALDFHNALGKS